MNFPEPQIGKKVKDYIGGELKKYFLSERVISGRGIIIKQVAGGRTVSTTAAEDFDHPFRVSSTASAVTITNGRHQWFRTTTNAYVETVLGNATSGWDALVPPPSSGNKLYLWVKREHDSGAVDTATITVGSATAAGSVPAPNYYTAVWIIAVITNTSGALSVEQRILEDIENDGPEIRQTGRIMLWNSTTIPRGWERYTGYDERFLVGYKTGGDYASVLGTGGFKEHDLSHVHNIAPQPDAITYEPGASTLYAWATNPGTVTTGTSGCINWDGTASGSGTIDAITIPSSPDCLIDNRPPWVAALFISKV